MRVCKRNKDFPGGTSDKEPASKCKGHKRPGFHSGKIPWRTWQPTPVVLPGESHGQRGLEGYSLWGHSVRQLGDLAHIHTS